MKQLINKYQTFLKERNILLKNMDKCTEIVSKKRKNWTHKNVHKKFLLLKNVSFQTNHMTQMVFNNNTIKLGAGKSNFSNELFDATQANLTTFINQIKKFNEEMEKSQSALYLSGEGFQLAHLMHLDYSVEQYKENEIGECLITNVFDVPEHHCHIVDVKM